MTTRREATATSEFGSGRRENHDSSAFYDRFKSPVISGDETVNLVPDFGDGCIVGDSKNMSDLPDNSVALVVTSPPYFVGKEYEKSIARKDGYSTGIPTSYLEYLGMLHDVFAECVRVLEPGGRIAINVANLGRRPYRSLSADVIRILQDELGLLLRGEVVWQKAEGATGSVAWGSFRSASNPVLRDLTERIIVASKGRFDRARKIKCREEEGLPYRNTVTTDEFMEATLDLWRIDAEQANRVGHPAPFPVELPRRLIDLYTFHDDVVLDPFLGSGSTLVAALRAGRRGVGYDIDEDYVEIAKQRLKNERKRLIKRSAEWRRADLTGYETKQGELFVGDTSMDGLLDQAVESGKKVSDIVKMALTEAGFVIVKEPLVQKNLGVQFPFAVTDSVEGRLWYIEVSGAFTTSRPGMRRADVLWKTLGRAHVLVSSYIGQEAIERPRLLILTPRLPKSGSDGDRALRAVGGSGFFDALEIFDTASSSRLSSYATQIVDRPLPGFWTEAEISDQFA